MLCTPFERDIEVLSHDLGSTTNQLYVENYKLRLCLRINLFYVATQLGVSTTAISTSRYRWDPAM